MRAGDVEEEEFFAVALPWGVGFDAEHAEHGFGGGLRCQGDDVFTAWGDLACGGEHLVAGGDRVGDTDGLIAEDADADFLGIGGVADGPFEGGGDGFVEERDGDGEGELGFAGGGGVGGDADGFFDFAFEAAEVEDGVDGARLAGLVFAATVVGIDAEAGAVGADVGDVDCGGAGDFEREGAANLGFRVGSGDAESGFFERDATDDDGRGVGWRGGGCGGRGVGLGWWRLGGRWWWGGGATAVGETRECARDNDCPQRRRRHTVGTIMLRGGAPT